MVRRKVYHPEMHITYLPKPRHTTNNAKASEKTKALIVPKDTFQRFVDYTTEEERKAEQREKEAAKIAALKKASYEKTKTWDTTIENIKARRREELLSKRQKAEEERKIFVEELAEKKAADRAEVVKQARKLLLQKKPLCRRINRALLASECFRELDAQVEFRKTIRAIDEAQDTDYANSIKTDVAKYEEQKRREEEERTRKTRDYRMDLKKQIEENKHENKLRATEELEMEKRDQRDVAQNMQFTKEKETQDILNKKKRLQQFFREAIEEKKRFELRMKRDEELEDRALETYRKAKDRIQKIHKATATKEKEERARRAQTIKEQYGEIAQTREAKEQEILEKAVKEKEAAEAEKRRAQKEREEAMRALVEEYKLQDAAVKTKQTQEEKETRAWEMMQRFKRDEYDKQVNLEERKRQWQQKVQYGNELWRDVEEKQAERKREQVLEIEATSTKDAIERANRKILLYGEEVLQESKGVRPLYPIIKAIEECKKEMGLTPLKRVEETVKTERPRRKHGVRRTCTKPVPADQVLYLQ